MKKTNTFTNIAMFVLFAAMLVYLGVYLFRSTQQSYATAPAVLVTVSESGQASGIVVREEQVIASDKEFLSLSVDDGKEVARGGEIAIGVDSKAALDSASRARELKKEIVYVSSLLSRAGSASGASDRDSDVRSAILQLNAAVSAGSTSELDDICMDLGSLLFGSTTGTVSQGDLDALNAELHQLENAGAGRGSITAPAAGLFTSTTDGYESLTPDMLENLTPDGVDALERTTPATPANAIGKLVTAKKWYFASVMNKADADRLNLGGSAALDFPQHYNGTVSATVLSKSEPDGSGKVAVVFACNAALADTLAMRKTTADVVYSEHTGLRVPLKAVHMDDDGQSYVYVVTAAQLEKKPIEIIYQTDDYCLVAQSTESNALRAGNEIVVTGKGLSNGQVVK